MPRPMLVLAPLLAVAFAAACARPVAVESEQPAQPAPVFTLEVVNPLDHDVVVSVVDASGRTLLGTVAANGRERFILATAVSNQVLLVATDPGRRHDPIEREVTLRAGEVTQVTLGR